MAVSSREFGVSPQGEKVTLYSITNGMGMQADIMDFGATLVKLTAPDKEGKLSDVVLGFETVEGYYENLSFFGATIGPNANRTGGAQYEIDGVVYQMDVNDGENNLHSHIQCGYHKRMWDVECGNNSVTFTLCDEDGCIGFPGNKVCSVTYTLTDAGSLMLHYHGESDKKTILNMTNHTYFNLDGHDSGSIENHELWLGASYYTPIANGSIPTGEIAPVAGTPMDFTHPIKIGERIENDFEQLKISGGYDHNYVLDEYDGSVRLFAKVEAPKSGRVLKAYTNLPGVQFYAGNYIDREEGKAGVTYRKRNGFCLETQFFPDAANKPQFASPVFGPDRIYDYTTIYEFSVK